MRAAAWTPIGRPGLSHSKGLSDALNSLSVEDYRHIMSMRLRTDFSKHAVFCIIAGVCVVLYAVLVSAFGECIGSSKL